MNADEGVTRVIAGGALHRSAQQMTGMHAHFAWKVHVGLDAPVWLRDRRHKVSDLRVLVVPPGVQHATGAYGWSAAIFLAPGCRRVPWRGPEQAFALRGAQAARLVDACSGYGSEDRAGLVDLADEVAGLVLQDLPQAHLDRRAEAALVAIAHRPGIALAQLAQEQGLSVDRLSRLVAVGTGMGLRRHGLWRRLLGVLSDPRRYSNLAAAAYAHGFADHAHMTRTYRAFFGRSPSEFVAPPDVVAPW